MKIFVNLITMFRLFFTIILAAVRNKLTEYSFVATVVALFFSDSIDGYLARRFNVQTFFGSIMDTVADKVLSIVLYLVLLNGEPVVAPILLCEFIIAIINICAIVAKRQPKSNKIGKTKTWFVAINIILGYLFYFDIVTYELLIISSILTFIMEIATIISYGNSLLKKSEKTKIKHKLENINDLWDILFNTEYYLSTL